MKYNSGKTEGYKGLLSPYWLIATLPNDLYTYVIHLLHKYGDIGINFHILWVRALRLLNLEIFQRPHSETQSRDLNKCRLQSLLCSARRDIETWREDERGHETAKHWREGSLSRPQGQMHI